MSEPEASQVRTLVAGFFAEQLPARTRPRMARLASEALLVTLLSGAITVALGLEAGGFVSLFLVAASLADRFSLLLDDNRRAIWDRQVAPRRANLRTALSILALFVGMLLGYGILATTLAEDAGDKFFGFAIEAAELGTDRVLGSGFSSPLRLLRHNVVVLGVIWCLCFLYRAYGAVLALSWNACVWAFVTTVLADRATSAHGFGGVVLVGALVSVLPHLLAEALGYIVGALSAIFASQGLARYGFTDPRLIRVLRASVTLLLFSILTLLAAAALESQLAPFLLGELFP